MLVFPKHQRGVPQAGPGPDDPLALFGSPAAEDEPEHATEPHLLSAFATPEDERTEAELAPAGLDASPSLPVRTSRRARKLRVRRATAKSARRLRPEQLAEMCLVGHGLFEAGRVEEARLLFEKVVAHPGSEAFPHTMLGTIYLAQGEYDRALERFEAALGFDARDVAARVYRGEIWLARGAVAQAVEDLMTVCGSSAPEDPFRDRAERLLALAQARTPERSR